MLVHDDALWLGELIPIDVALIHKITSLPDQGADPMANFGGKVQEKAVTEKIK